MGNETEVKQQYPLKAAADIVFNARQEALGMLESLRRENVKLQSSITQNNVQIEKYEAQLHEFDGALRVLDPERV